ncbi:MAG TPA: hypothetical protein VFV08_15790, partial [Puia sp.]|nr:hypothetical protein [Puia sp.]
MQKAALLAFLFLPFCSEGQQLKITDFAIFGGSASPLQGAANAPSPGRGVQLSSSTSIQGGSVGSYIQVTSSGSLTINGNVYSNGTVQLNNGNSVSGRIAVGNSSSISGNALSVGSNAIIGGNIDVNGNINIKSGTVSGQVTHPIGTTYSGPAPGLGEKKGSPSIPGMPAFPVISNFPAKGAQNITSTATLLPNQSYGNVTLGGNSTITFSGPGIYTFNSIQNSGNVNSFVFDFK